MMLPLIERANRTYALGLDADQRSQLEVLLCRRLGATASASTVIDAVIKTADAVKRSKPRNVYAGLKTEAAAETNRCPRCGTDMRAVALVQDRQSRYCLACNITLPMRRDV